MRSKSNIRRVGVFGAGAMGRKHLEAWQLLGVPVAGLYARDFQRGKAAAEFCGCPVFDSMPALLDNIEIADICLPTFLHRSAIALAAQAGCDIVCEKPLALDPVDAEAIFDLCESAGVRLFVAMVVRFFPAYRKVWQTARLGSLGPLRGITLQRIGSPPPPEGSWFLNHQLSGGMLTDLLIHDVDYSIWLAGDVATVRAIVKDHGRLQYANVTLKHTSGILSQIEGGWIDAPPGLQDGGEVVCSGGNLQIAPSNLQSPADDPYVAQLRHFHDALVCGEPFLVRKAEVLRVVRTMAAARVAARDGHTIAIEPAAAEE
jgi:myo-inositol 2-dehydrogenase/D-chiro-inositol 1-dehydrogenase